MAVEAYEHLRSLDRSLTVLGLRSYKLDIPMLHLCLWVARVMLQHARAASHIELAMEGQSMGRGRHK